MKAPILPLLFMGLVASATSRSSEDTPALKEALEKFPEADANGDGILTLEEAREYRKKAQGPKRGQGAPHAAGERRVYKRVDGKPLPLFIHRPPGHEADAKAPAILLFHGGGFRSGSPSQFNDQAAHFASRGLVAMTITYRLTRDEGVTTDDCIEDAKSAMRWARAHADELGIDPGRIAAGGGSAGGFLSVATAVMDGCNAAGDSEGVSERPDAMILFNPAYGPAGNDGRPDPRDPGGKGRLVQYVKPGQPPLIHFFGAKDPFLPGAREFEEAYRKAGNRCEALVFEDEGHGFFNKPGFKPRTLAAADRFLAGLGWIKPEEAAR